MYSITCNSKYTDFNVYGNFFDGRGIDNVIIGMHKLQQYCGLRQIKTFCCYDVIKNPNIPFYLTSLEKHLEKYVI